MACTVAIIDNRPAVAQALQRAISAQPGFSAHLWSDNTAASLLVAGCDDPRAFPADDIAAFRRHNPGGLTLGLLAAALDPAARSACDRVVERPARLGDILRALRALSLWPAPVQLGPYLFRPGERVLRRTAQDGTAHVSHLTDKEAALLSHLATAPGHAASREALLGAVWHYADGISTRTVESHVYRLRQKLEHDPNAPGILVTTADGYRLVSAALSTVRG